MAAAALSAAEQTGPSTNTTTTLWSDILQRVGSSKQTLSRNLLVLGDPQCGKSMFIAQLRQSSLLPLTSAATSPDPQSARLGHNPSTSGTDGNASMGTSTADLEHPGQSTAGGGSGNPGGDSEFLDASGGGNVAANDLALGYSYLDVKDDDQDEVARIGVYQLADTHNTYQALFKYSLNRESVGESCVTIVLDWSKPWQFVDQLQKWLLVVEQAVEAIRQSGHSKTGGDKASTWSQGQVVVDECREQLQKFVQTYTEPTESSTAGLVDTQNPPSAATAITATTAAAQKVILPLGPGTLTTNLGIPIVVVCCKADAIAKLEREQDYKEDHFDFIQQSLRTICLKYGASLFYTSIQRPETYHYVYRYIVHRLTHLNNPATLAMALGTANEDTNMMMVDDDEGPSPNHAVGRDHEATASGLTHRKPVAFPHRAHVVERDVVLVPAGWDSWAKVQILRDGYDCQALFDGWDQDLTARKEKQATASIDASANADARMADESAVRVFAEVIPNPHAGNPGLTIANTVRAEDDQVFLDQLYRNQQQSSADSAQGSLPPPPVHVATTLSTVTDHDGHTRALDAVTAASAHLMGSDGLFASTHAKDGVSNGSLATEDLSAKLARMAKLRDAAAAAAAAGTPLSATTTATDATPDARQSSSSSASGLSGVLSQKEFYANYFQSLLSRKPSTSSPGSAPANKESAGSTSSTTSKDVAAELERLRSQFNAKKNTAN
ncbi:hypothetical protein H4R34_001815 [Dimargaris verticillata]|uniref:Dynein light intermediate chain-domain-containing protein n=1 Tax=Dimargaris verticillata TaxID=2761393 RepID=A0A9W8B3Q1_9FUNG|nr:hypothetical protein H4R34_001815 [Dimargaris verticillata]